MPLFYDAHPFDGRQFTSEQSARDIVDWINRFRLPRKVPCAAWLDGRLFIPGDTDYGDDDVFVEPGSWVVGRSGRFAVVGNDVMQSIYLTHEYVHGISAAPSEGPDA